MFRGLIVLIASFGLVSNACTAPSTTAKTRSFHESPQESNTEEPLDPSYESQLLDCGPTKKDQSGYCLLEYVDTVIATCSERIDDQTLTEIEARWIESALSTFFQEFNRVERQRVDTNIRAIRLLNYDSSGILQTIEINTNYQADVSCNELEKKDEVLALAQLSLKHEYLVKNAQRSLMYACRGLLDMDAYSLN